MKKKKGILTVLLCVFFLWGCQSCGEQIKEPEIELQEQAGQQNSEEEEDEATDEIGVESPYGREQPQ